MHCTFECCELVIFFLLKSSINDMHMHGVPIGPPRPSHFRLYRADIVDARERSCERESEKAKVQRCNGEARRCEGSPSQICTPAFAKLMKKNINYPGMESGPPLPFTV